MKDKIVYLDDLSWIPNPDDEIEKMIEKYDEQRKDEKKSKYSISLENGEIAEVDFEKDPDWALLLEYQDELYDPDGNYIFDKKIVKNWKYFNQTSEDFEFYVDKAKYILKTYWYYQQEIQFMKKGEHLRKMSYEMLVSVLDNLRFLEKCMNSRLSEYSAYLELIYKDGLPFDKVAELTGVAKSTVQLKVEKGIKELARSLVAKERFAKIGEQMFANLVDMHDYNKELELNDKLELVGELATALKIKLDALDNKTE